MDYRTPDEKKPCRRTFIALGSGINSNYGIIGLGFESSFEIGKVPIQWALNVGVGSWGGKAGGEMRVNYSGCPHHGGALAIGFVHSSGLDSLQWETTINNTTRPSTLRLFPQNNLHLSWYRSFRLGRGAKFFLQAGYSIAFSPRTYEVIRGSELSREDKGAIEVLRPGGLTLALGFGFSLGE